MDERARAAAEIIVERCDHDGSPHLCDYCAETARLVADAVAQGNRPCPKARRLALEEAAVIAMRVGTKSATAEYTARKIATAIRASAKEDGA